MFARRGAAMTVVLVVAVCLAAALPARADVITSPDNAFEVGINPQSTGTFNGGGNLFDPNFAVGFLRTADGYDPIRPGTPREAYGVSAGSVGGYVDPTNPNYPAPLPS